MNKILILEDEVVQANAIKRIINELSPKIEVLKSTNVRDAKKIISNTKLDLFFLDIRLSDGSGVELAKEIRKNDLHKFSPIVFISGMPNLELMAFRETSCYKFIKKPVTIEELKKQIKGILFTKDKELVMKNKDKIYLEFKGFKRCLRLNEVIAIECAQRRIHISTINGEIDYKKMTLNEFSKDLNDDFIQVHQSFLINKFYIKNIDTTNNIIFLKCLKKEIPIGKTYKWKLSEILRLEVYC
jgi:DNA-binding LytR/AlgR family response regulator